MLCTDSKKPKFRDMYRVDLGQDESPCSFHKTHHKKQRRIKTKWHPFFGPPVPASDSDENRSNHQHEASDITENQLDNSNHRHSLAKKDKHTLKRAPPIPVPPPAAASHTDLPTVSRAPTFCLDTASDCAENDDQQSIDVLSADDSAAVGYIPNVTPMMTAVGTLKTTDSSLNSDTRVHHSTTYVNSTTTNISVRRNPVRPAFNVLAAPPYSNGGSCAVSLRRESRNNSLLANNEESNLISLFVPGDHLKNLYSDSEKDARNRGPSFVYEDDSESISEAEYRHPFGVPTVRDS